MSTSVSDLIATLADGDVNTILTEQLARVLSAVEAGHGDGKLVITIAVAAEKGIARVEATCKATVPVRAAAATLMELRDAELHRDERQAVIEFPRAKRGREPS